MRLKCLKCNAKKTVTFNAFDFFKYCVKPYLTNPDEFKKYRKTIEFFEKNKKTILTGALKEIDQHLQKTERWRQELDELRKLCKATALL